MVAPRRLSRSVGGGCALHIGSRGWGGLLVLAVAPACVSFAGLSGGGDAGPDGTSPARDAGADGHPEDAADAPADVASEPLVDCSAFTLPAASSLTDSFDGSTLPAGWFSPEHPPCTTEDNALVASASASFCLFFTSNDYELACSSVSVEVTMTPIVMKGVQTLMGAYFTFADGGKGQVLVLLDGGNFEFELKPAATFKSIGSYDPARDRWWRFRGRGGTLYFDTSPDGTTYVERGSIGTTSDPLPLGAVTIGLGAGELAGVDASDPGEARFRCYNLPPTQCQ
jgi:hypothetical protein